MYPRPLLRSIFDNMIGNSVFVAILKIMTIYSHNMVKNNNHVIQTVQIVVDYHIVTCFIIYNHYFVCNDSVFVKYLV
jgi:hypothetical protein